MSKPLLTYGLKDEKLVHVDELPNGNKCRCICPQCKGKLGVWNGANDGGQQHHFKHNSGAECKGAQMTALHLLAQEIIKDEKRFFLPDYRGQYLQHSDDSRMFYGRATDEM